MQSVPLCLHPQNCQSLQLEQELLCGVDLCALLLCHPPESIQILWPTGNSSRPTFHLVNRAFQRLCITVSLARWSVFINLAGTSRELTSPTPQPCVMEPRGSRVFKTSHDKSFSLLILNTRCPVQLTRPLEIWCLGKEKILSLHFGAKGHPVLRKSEDFTAAALSPPSAPPLLTHIVFAPASFYLTFR